MRFLFSRWSSKFTVSPFWFSALRTKKERKKTKCSSIKHFEKPAQAGPIWLVSIERTVSQGNIIMWNFIANQGQDSKRVRVYIQQGTMNCEIVKWCSTKWTVWNVLRIFDMIMTLMRCMNLFTAPPAGSTLPPKSHSQIRLAFVTPKLFLYRMDVYMWFPPSLSYNTQRI